MVLFDLPLVVGLFVVGWLVGLVVYLVCWLMGLHWLGWLSLPLVVWLVGLVWFGWLLIGWLMVWLVVGGWLDVGWGGMVGWLDGLVGLVRWLSCLFG